LDSKYIGSLKNSKKIKSEYCSNDSNDENVDTEKTLVNKTDDITEALIARQVLPCTNEFSLSKQIQYLTLSKLYFNKFGQILTTLSLFGFMFGVVCI
jgi:hypothetical protein